MSKNLALTGEPRDANGLQHHRARYYAPGLAVWTALDPWEGLYTRPMSLNGYAYVSGDPINRKDPSGMADCMFCGGPLEFLCFGACQAAPACDWPEYQAIQELLPLLIGAAQRWNRIPPADCAMLMTDCHPAAIGSATRMAGDRCQTGLSNEAFVALMAAIIHNEGWLASLVSPLSDAGKTLYERGGDFLGIFSALKENFPFPGIGLIGLIPSHDASVGLGNIKWDVVKEMFKGVVDPNPHFDSIRFNIENRPEIGWLQELAAWYQRYAVGEVRFRERDDVGVELLAINIYRGILRAKSSRTPTISDATIFNLAAWHNQGHQDAEAYDLNTGGIADSVVYANDVLRYMRQIVEGPCSLGRLVRPTPWADFLYYNEVDLRYVRMGPSGGFPLLQ